MTTGGAARGAADPGSAAKGAVRYFVKELARAGGVSPRTVRFYVERGLLPSPKLRGMGATYGEEHLLRIRAIQRLQRDEKLALDVIQRRLAKLTPAELAELAAPPPSAAPAPAAPPVEAQAARAAEPAGAGRADVATAVPAEPARGAAPRLGAEQWERIVLVPGLELHVRSDAGPLLWRLAGEIQRQYAASARID